VNDDSCPNMNGKDEAGLSQDYLVLSGGVDVSGR